MSEFKKYRRTQIAEMRPWTPDVDMTTVSVSVPDKEAGSPKAGDMIARNPKNHADQWLVAAQYFADNFEPMHPADSFLLSRQAEKPPVVLDPDDLQAQLGHPAKD